MTKSVKSMIALGSTLVVLGAGALAWKLAVYDKQEVNEESSSSEVEGAGIELITKDSSTISNIEISNSTGDFKVYRVSDATADTKAIFTIEGYEDIPVNNSLIWTLPNNTSNVVSESIIDENPENLDIYGLENPDVTATIFYDSGESIKFYLGDVTPTGTSTYFMLDGDNTVYTTAVSLFANYRVEKDNFVSTTILEAPEETSYPIINEVVIKRQDLDYDIVIQYDSRNNDENYNGGTSATHILVEPIQSYLGVDRSITVTNGLFGLTATEIYSVIPNENDIAEVGLADPFCTLTLDCDNGQFLKFIMSEPFSGEDGLIYHYAMLEGVNVIYVVSADSATWGTLQLEDFTSKNIFGTTVWDINKLVVSAPTLENPIEFDCEGTSKEDFNVLKDNAEFNTERFRLFYAFLIDAPAETFAIGKTIPDGATPNASIQITEDYQGNSYTVEFYDDTNLNSLIVVDGECRFVCSKSYVDTLIENINRISTGEDYLTTWR